MPDKLVQIPTKDCTISKQNVNFKKGDKRNVDDLLGTIPECGIFQPVIATNGNDGYEIVAGARRLIAARQLELETIPAIMITPDQAADAILVSTVENVAREQMSPLDEYDAFAALHEKGKSIADIAVIFNITEQMVSRRLALADLVPGVKALFENGDIKDSELFDLTLATKQKQKEFVRLAKKGERVWNIRSWLFDGGMIETTAALFDLALYKGPLIKDLFRETTYFGDPDAFWELQNVSIDVITEENESRGWQVEIHRTPYFPLHEWVKTKKAGGGIVIVAVRPNGHVDVHTGYLPAKKSKKKAKSDDQAKSPTAELTQTAQQYARLQRAGLVQEGLYGGLTDVHAQAALLAGIIYSGVATRHYPPTTPVKKALEAYLDCLAWKQLSEVVSDISRLEAQGYSATYLELLETSQEHRDLLQRAITALTLPPWSDDAHETVAQSVNLSGSINFKNRDQFIDMIRDQKVLANIAHESGLINKAEGAKPAPKALKAALKDKLPEDYVIRYFEFPAGCYVKQTGLAMIKAGKTAQKKLVSA